VIHNDLKHVKIRRKHEQDEVGSCGAVLCFSSTLAFGQEAKVDTKTQPKTPDPCTSGHEFATTDCALTWHGITLYGSYDAGAGWVSHGLPENGSNYEGESLVNRNGYQHRFLMARTTCSRQVCIRARKSFCLAGLSCSTLQRASIHSPACSPTRQPP